MSGNEREREQMGLMGCADTHVPSVAWVPSVVGVGVGFSTSVRWAQSPFPLVRGVHGARARFYRSAFTALTLA